MLLMQVKKLTPMHALTAAAAPPPSGPATLPSVGAVL